MATPNGSTTSGRREKSKYKWIHVSIQPTIGTPFTLCVSASTRVSSLKENISDRMGLSPQKMTLLHKSRQLESGTLKSNSVGDGAEIRLVPALESGVATVNSVDPIAMMKHSMSAISDQQIDDFLSGKSPLSVAIRVGESVVVVNLHRAKMEDPDTPSSSSSSSSSSSEPPPMKRRCISSQRFTTNDSDYSEPYAATSCLSQSEGIHRLNSNGPSDSCNHSSTRTARYLDCSPARTTTVLAPSPSSIPAATALTSLTESDSKVSTALTTTATHESSLAHQAATKLPKSRPTTAAVSDDVSMCSHPKKSGKAVSSLSMHPPASSSAGSSRRGPSMSSFGQSTSGVAPSHSVLCEPSTSVPVHSSPSYGSGPAMTFHSSRPAGQGSSSSGSSTSSNLTRRRRSKYPCGHYSHHHRHHHHHVPLQGSPLSSSSSSSSSSCSGGGASYDPSVARPRSDTTDGGRRSSAAAAADSGITSKRKAVMDAISEILKKMYANTEKGRFPVSFKGRFSSEFTCDSDMSEILHSKTTMTGDGTELDDSKYNRTDTDPADLQRSPRKAAASKAKLKEHEQLKYKISNLKWKMQQKRAMKLARRQRLGERSPCGWMEALNYEVPLPAPPMVRETSGYCGMKRGFLLAD